MTFVSDAFQTLRKQIPGQKSLRFFYGIWGLLFLATGAFLLKWGYAHARSAEYFNLPLIPFLATVPPEIHAALVFAFLLPALLLLLGRAPVFSSAAIACLMVYYMLFDLFAFHHGWVVVGTMAALLALMSYGLNKGNQRNEHPMQAALGEDWAASALFCVKALTITVYLAAGIHKLNQGFLDGLVVAELVYQKGGWFAELLSDYPWMRKVAGPLACTLEIGIGLCLLFPKLHRAALCMVLALHLGIFWTTKAGRLFHILMPACVVFFYWARVETQTLYIPKAWRWKSQLTRWDWLGVWKLQERDIGTPSIANAPDANPWLALMKTVPLLNPLFLLFAIMYGIVLLELI